jgi:spore coat polysaccharide biosynthesis protein SpsF
MYKNDNIVAIIQARMGSERLPGKVLMDIAGRPMLWHVINRIKHSRYIDKVIIATTINKDDKQIEDFCKTYNIDFYRGSEDDVLDRYYQTATLWNADIIVRITSDCPLIDSGVVDKVICSYLKNKNNFNGSSNVIKRTYPRGLDTEVISFSALERVWNDAKKDYQREHVTIYIYEHAGKFKLYSVENDKDLSHYRWTVDEKKDLKFVREIYKLLYREENIFSMNDILGLLKIKPHLEEINKDIEQKKIVK